MQFFFLSAFSVYGITNRKYVLSGNGAQQGYENSTASTWQAQPGGAQEGEGY